jgi:hypothetical protein
LIFSPHQSGVKSSTPTASAFVRKAEIAAVASGNSGVSALIGPISRMLRFSIPRAGLPLKIFVMTVLRGFLLFIAAR